VHVLVVATVLVLVLFFFYVFVDISCFSFYSVLYSSFFVFLYSYLYRLVLLLLFLFLSSSFSSLSSSSCYLLPSSLLVAESSDVQHVAVGKEGAREVKADGQWLFLRRFIKLDDCALNLSLDDAERSHAVHLGDDRVRAASKSSRVTYA